jgi:hypothetical protein
VKAKDKPLAYLKNRRAQMEDLVMNFCKNSYSWRRVIRATFIVAVTAAWASVAHAQTDDASTQALTTTPYSLFQYSTLTGLGNTIFAGRVPVANSTGTTKYYDVTIQFNVDSAGNLTLASGYPKVASSPTLIVSGFKAGKYVGPSNVLSGQAIINVSGPSVTSGGATQWSLAAGSGASVYTYPCSATWYVGPITSNPLYSRLKAAGITSTAWYYGVIGSSGCAPDSGHWYPDSLVGLSQTGNTITIVSFTYAGSQDHSTPQDQITYTPTP